MKKEVQSTEIFNNFIVCWKFNIMIDDDDHINSYSVKNSVISIIYLIIGVICIILLNQPAFWPGFMVKALIIPVLIMLFLLNLKPLTNRLHLFMIAGLLFSWAGDIILEFSESNGNMFIPGLICFLLAHIMYLTVFISTPGKNSLLSSRALLLLPVIVYGLGLVLYLYSDLNEMKLPVIIYAIVILLMLTGAINRIDKVKKKSYWLVLSGAILFVISDSAIAVNKFSYKFEYSGILIMSTYITAQYLITKGYIEQFGKEGTDQIR
jgi:uncharacterized membrane protein YhhN